MPRSETRERKVVNPTFQRIDWKEKRPDPVVISFDDGGWVMNTVEGCHLGMVHDENESHRAP